MTIVLLWGQPSTRMPGGAEQFTDLLQKAIPELKVVYPDNDSIPAWPFLSEPAKAWAAAQTLEKKMDELKPEIVFYNGMFGWALPPKTSYTKIALCHGTFPSFARHALEWGLNRLRTQFIYADFEKKSYANADKIICNSIYSQQNLKKDYDLDSSVIPLATDAALFSSKKEWREKLKLPVNKKIILFVGRPTNDKGFDIVEKIASRHQEWKVISVTNPRAQSTIVDARGPLPFRELVHYFLACDAVLFPSRFESFGYVTIEALAAHKPVITTPFGVAREINHPLCIIVNDYSLDAFEEELSRVFASPPRGSGVESLMKQYDLPRFTREYQRLVKEVRARAQK